MQFSLSAFIGFVIGLIRCAEMERNPVFLKFHKVGSGSISSCLREMYVKSSSIKTYWKPQSTCGGDPFTHSTLFKYQSTMLMSDCVERTNPSEVEIVAMFREPLEKIISQLVFFNDEVHLSISNSSEMNSTMHKMLGDTQSITAEEMIALVRSIKSKPRVHSKFASNIVLNEYEMVFSKNSKLPFLSSPVTASAAVHNMIQDVRTIGVLEYIPSFLYLLSKHLNVSLPCHCQEDHAHGMGARNMQYFASPTR
jgi:hypothetical protein